MDRFVYTIEGLNVWVGRAFGWCILILTLSVSYEVFVRYVLNAPNRVVDGYDDPDVRRPLLDGRDHMHLLRTHTSGETFLYRLLSLKHKEK